MSKGKHGSCQVNVLEWQRELSRESNVPLREDVEIRAEELGRRTGTFDPALEEKMRLPLHQRLVALILRK